MNILVDVSAGQSVADAIVALGHDTVAVRDRAPTMADPDILALLGPPGNEGITQMVVYAYTDAPDVRSASKSAGRLRVHLRVAATRSTSGSTPVPRTRPC